MRLQKAPLALTLVALVACASDRTASTRQGETRTTPHEAAAVMATLRAVPEIGEQLHRGSPASQGAFASGLLLARVPTRASGALRLDAPPDHADPDVWLEITPRGLSDVEGVEHDGARVFASALATTDLVYVAHERDVEEVRLARSLAGAAKATYDLRLGSKLTTLHVVDQHLEVLDAEGRARFRTTRAFAVDAKGVRRDVVPSVHGSTLEMTLDVAGLTPPIAIDPAWTAASSLTGIRLQMAAAKLGSGKVLVIGGSLAGGGSGGVGTTEMYDPATNTWTTKASLVTARAEHTATAMDSGKRILVVGGYGTTTLTSAEIYDAASNTFTTKTLPATTPAGDTTPHAGRRSHSAILGKDGRVFIFGGRTDGSSYYDSILAFNPSTDTFAVMGAKFPQQMKDVVPTLLADGRIALTGGTSRDSFGKDRISRYTFLFDPSADTLVSKADMPVARSGHGAVVLSGGTMSGKLYVFGGGIPNLDEVTLVPSLGAAVYDFSTDSWAIAPFMGSKRAFLGWTPMVGGRILAAGGASDISGGIFALSSAEVFDPAVDKWLPAGSMTDGRAASGVTVALDDGSVLVAGGVKSAFEGFLTAISSAERFSLVTKGKACTEPGECVTGNCADKTCCDTACANNCAACDIAGKEGTCSPVTGKPHGTRSACTGGTGDCAATCDGTDTTKCNFPGASAACGTNACKAGVETHVSTCDGAGTCKDVPTSCGELVCGSTACLTTCTTKADCVNASHFCEAGKCIPQQANGSACTRDEACAGGLCVDGVCCESKCEGQCQACDVPGQAGKCVPIKGKPHGKRTDCEKNAADPCASKACDGSNTTACAATVGPCSGYACDDVAKECKKICLADPDCGTGYQCESGKCVPKSSKCSGDYSSMIGADGKTTACAPLVCRDRVCLTKCVTSADCQGGFSCDGAGTCAPVSAGGDTSSSGGCAMAQHDEDQERPLIVPLMVLAFCLVRRRYSGRHHLRHRV